MACTYTGSLDGDRIMSLQEALDRRERMLCALCTLIEKEADPVTVLSVLRRAAFEADGLDEDDIARWWAEHKEAENEGGG